MRALITVLLLATAVPAFAEDAPAHLYTSNSAVVVKGIGDTDATAKTDPLDLVDEIALQASVICGDSGCAGAQTEIRIETDSSTSAALTFTPVADGLRAEVAGQPVTLALKQGETFQVRIHWNAGHRVTFDLYRTDPATGSSAMESHEVQLDSPVRDLALRASHSQLTLLNQAYSFTR